VVGRAGLEPATR